MTRKTYYNFRANVSTRFYVQYLAFQIAEKKYILGILRDNMQFTINREIYRKELKRISILWHNRKAKRHVRKSRLYIRISPTIRQAIVRMHKQKYRVFYSLTVSLFENIVRAQSSGHRVTYDKKTNEVSFTPK